MMRGVNKANAGIKTSKTLGGFKEQAETRREFIAQVNTGS